MHIKMLHLQSTTILFTYFGIQNDLVNCNLGSSKINNCLLTLAITAGSYPATI